MTKVISIRSGLPYDVYIGRPGKGQEGPFGNPIIVGRKCSKCGEWHRDGGSTIPCYRKYLAKRIIDDVDFFRAVINLRGKTLACFCVPAVWTYSPEIDPSTYICHGQVLAQIADGISDEWSEYWAKQEEEFFKETGIDPFSQDHWDDKMKTDLLRENQGNCLHCKAPVSPECFYGRHPGCKEPGCCGKDK